MSCQNLMGDNLYLFTGQTRDVAFQLYLLSPESKGFFLESLKLEDYSLTTSLVEINLHFLGLWGKKVEPWKILILKLPNYFTNENSLSSITTRQSSKIKLTKSCLLFVLSVVFVARPALLYSLEIHLTHTPLPHPFIQ